MSNCGCVYQQFEGDQARFSTTTMPKARKSHTCCECGDSIPVGATYERVTGKYYDELVTYTTCLLCVEIRGALMCDGWTYTQLWEDIRNYMQEGGKIIGCLEELETVAAKQKLQEAWREHLELDELDSPQERDQ